MNKQLRQLSFALISILMLALLQTAHAQISTQEQKPPLSSAQKVYEQVSHSIFTIFGVETEGTNKGVALGSAVAIDKNILATNCHVAFAGNFLIVYINNSPLRGELYYYDKENDLCLIKIPETTFYPVTIRPSTTVNIGEEVFAIGNPEGYEKTISKGIISNKYVKDKHAMLQTDASISHGSSGGGLFDSEGNLIGITTSVDESGTNIGFAIPTELILDALAQEKSSPDTKPISTIDSTTTEQKLLPDKQEPQENLDPNTPQAPSNIDAKNLTTIDFYGKSNIGLSKIGSTCLISIIGRQYERNSIPENKSLAFWSPNTPNILFIIPSTSDIKDAAILLSNYLANTNPDFQLAHSIFVFESKLYEMKYNRSLDEKYSVMLADVKINFTEDLLTGDEFIIQFYNFRNTSGMTTIRFELDGFTEALAAYNKNCEK